MKSALLNKPNFDLFLKIVIFVVAAALRIACMNDKYGMHEDEVMSFSISNYSDFWCSEFPSYQYRQGKKLAADVFFHDAKFSSALNDVMKLWRDNRDRPHTNLYYSCLRLWMTPISSINFSDSIRHAVWLNFIFFIFSFFIMLRLLKKTQLNPTVQNCLLVSVFFNSISVSNVAFIRPYALQETLLLLFSSIFVEFWNKAQIDQKKNFVIFVMVTAFTLLSGYFATIYVLLLVGFLIYKLPSGRLFFTSAFLSSILLSQMLFCGYFYGFSCGRAGESFHNFSPSVFFRNFHETMPIYEDLFGSVFHWILLLFIAASVSRREKIRPEVFVISGSAFFIALFISFISPIKHVRYAMPFLPQINLAFFMVGKFLFDLLPNIRRISGRKFKIICLSALVAGFFRYDTSRFSFPEQRQIREMLNTSTQTFVFMRLDWHLNRILHLLGDTKTYCLITSMENLMRLLNEEREAIILIPYDEEINFGENFNIEFNKLFYENLGKYNALRIYKISRK